jgi:hypothetical protein
MRLLCALLVLGLLQGTVKDGGIVWKATTSGVSGSVNPFAEDVPAVQVTVPTWGCFSTMEGCAILDRSGKPATPDDWYGNPGKYHMTRQSCADKIRILLHDEQDPPNYWCHKVNAGAAKTAPK